jgi:hypothetical protein
MGGQERVDHRTGLGAERTLEIAELDDLEDRFRRPAGRGGLGGQSGGGRERGQRRREQERPRGDGSSAYSAAGVVA